jgi:hypothetical protein
MLRLASKNGWACGATMKPMRVTAIVGLLGVSLVAQPALAFQENAPSGTQQPPPPSAAAVETPKAVDQNKGFSLRTPELSIGKGSGTEVRIPGIGSVGVLPKLDFGLELLYGATEQRGAPDDKSEPPADVQIRGTIKHRF